MLNPVCFFFLGVPLGQPVLGSSDTVRDVSAFLDAKCATNNSAVRLRFTIIWCVAPPLLLREDYRFVFRTRQSTARCTGGGGGVSRASNVTEGIYIHIYVVKSRGASVSGL